MPQNCYDYSMNTFSTIVAIVGGVLALIGLVAFAIAYFRSSLAKDTITLHEKNAKALEDRVKILEESDVAKTKKISELEGEVKTLKTIPLEKLSASYETMAQTLKGMGETQNKMLELMTTVQAASHN